MSAANHATYVSAGEWYLRRRNLRDDVVAIGHAVGAICQAIIAHGPIVSREYVASTAWHAERVDAKDTIEINDPIRHEAKRGNGGERAAEAVARDEELVGRGGTTPWNVADIALQTASTPASKPSLMPSAFS